MNNFESRVKQPWTTYDNRLIQEKTIFKNANQKLCYLFLVSYANASQIFPSMESIATALCSTSRTAMTIIQQLEEMGLIEVTRTPGLPNQYVLNDYFETSEKFSPVKNLHQTHEKISPVPVKNFHPKTNNLKLKTKNKISLDLEADAIAKINLELQESNKDIPVNEISDKLLKDIEQGTLKASTEAQYKGLMKKRIVFFQKERKKAQEANTGVKKGKKNPIRTEMLPEWFNEKEEQPAPKQTDSTDEAKKQAIKAKLDAFRK